MIRDGLWCAFDDCHMGTTAENIARDFEVSRDDQDVFAAASQQKAEAAIAGGRFKDEIVAVPVQRKKEQVLVDTDEHPRSGTTVDSLRALRPAFAKDGTVTAGNASGINDGAAAVVVMSDDRAKAEHRVPLARIRSYSSAGVAPRIMGMGPVPSVKLALQKAGVELRDIDLFELNEAFAAQSVAVGRELAIPEDKLNVNGGAIALGHPIGASGTRILVTLLHEMLKRDANLGVAALCIGGGQASRWSWSARSAGRYGPPTSDNCCRGVSRPSDRTCQARRPCALVGYLAFPRHSSPPASSLRRRRQVQPPSRAHLCISFPDCSASCLTSRALGRMELR